MSLSNRLRPDVEAAPWVIEEIKLLEKECDMQINRSELLAEDIESLHMCLDDAGVPRRDAGGNVFSMWGRVLRYKTPNVK